MVLPALGRLSAFVLAAMLITACRDHSSSDEPVRITVAVSILSTERNAYEEVAGAVAADLGFEVEIIARQYEEIRRALAAESMGGRGTLDVVEVDVFDLPAVAEHVRPLPDPPDLPLLNEAARTSGVLGGERLFLPHRLNWQAMIVNTQRVASPPATWDDLLAVAQRHSGQIGFKADLYEGLTCDLLPFLWQAGGDPLTPAAPENVTAMRFLQELGPHLNPASQGYREQSVLTAQEQGEVVLHQNWPFAVRTLRDAGVLPEVHGTAPLPAGPAGQATVLGGGFLAVSTVAPHPEEAARFVQEMTGADAQRGLVRALGWFPVREDAWDALSPEDQELCSGFIAMMPHVRARPVREDYRDISALWQEAFQRIVFQREDVDAVLADIAGRMPTG